MADDPATLYAPGSRKVTVTKLGQVNTRQVHDFARFHAAAVLASGRRVQSGRPTRLTADSGPAQTIQPRGAALCEAKP